MFTGIIQSIGKVVSIRSTSAGARLAIDLGKLAGEVTPGGSVAVNGACLSATAFSGSVVDFDVIFETLSRTNLGQLTPGQEVNLELPLRASDRIEGHFVLGHVDTLCRIARWQSQGGGRLLTLEPTDPATMQFIVPKCSVAVDGISLTVANISARYFSIALIPTTLANTTLIQKSAGALVNLETDILVKTLISYQQRALNSNNKLMDTLKHSGFIN